MQYCKSETQMLKEAPHTPFIGVFTERKIDGKCNYAISIVLCHFLKFSTHGQLVFFLLWVVLVDLQCTLASAMSVVTAVEVFVFFGVGRCCFYFGNGVRCAQFLLFLMLVGVFTSY